MRALVVLYMALTLNLWWLWQLLLLALAWDVYETMKPGLKIITTAPKGVAVPPLAANLASLLEKRKECAQTNNCTECQKFMAQFEALMQDHPVAVPGTPGVPGVPEPMKNGHAHGGAGYL